MRTPALLALLLLQLPPALGQTAPAPEPEHGKAMFETHCGTCHSLALPKSQRLNRANWKWVIDDMVNQFGATWITDAQQALILDYLVENYGPDRPH